jgi:hypothetical protein
MAATQHAPAPAAAAAASAGGSYLSVAKDVIAGTAGELG